MIKMLNGLRRPNPGRIAWVGDVSASPSEIPLLLRGDLATPGPKVGPGVPAFLIDADNRFEPKPPYRRLVIDRAAAGAGAMAHSAWHAPGCTLGSRAGQPDLATSFRNRPGRDFRQPRLHRIAADPSRIARIPGSGAGSLRLECQGASSPDRVLLGLPAIECSKPAGWPG